MILRLTKGQLILLKKEARKSYPVEACALLFGILTDEEAIVERVVAAPNVLKSSVRFEIDSKTFYDAFTESNKDGLELVGFFHSHPASASPSGVDLQFMRLWADAVWLIFSSLDDSFAAFQMRRGRAYQVDLIVEGKLKE